MSRRLDISLHLDRSQQAKAEAEARADSAKTAKQVISDADMAEKEKAKRAKESAAARAKSEKELAAEITKAKKQAAAEFNAIMRQSEAEAKKIDAERVASENKANAERLASERKTAQDAMRAQLQKANEARRLLAQETQEQKKLTDAQMGTVTSMVKMGAAMIGIQSVSSVFTSIIADLDKSRSYAQKTAEEIFKIRGAIRELAALRGELGSTGPTTAHVLGMQAQTLQSAEDVNSMEQAGLGVGELAIGKTISKEDFDKSMIAAGKMQTLEGGSASAYGALTGQIALQSDHKLSPEEVQARINRMYEIQKPGGFTNMSQAIEQNSQLSGYVMNKILTPEQAMGTLSAFSAVGPPAQAGSTTEQFVRATLGNQIRAKGGQLDPDLDTEKTFEYFKGLGVDKENDPIKIGKAIAADIDKQRKADPNFSPYRHLQTHGFGNQQDRNAIMAFSGLHNSGNLAKIEEAQNKDLDMSGVIDKRYNQRVAGDPFFQRKQADTLNSLVNAEKGIQQEPIEIARRAAFASLKSEGKQYGEYEDWGNPSAASQTISDLKSFRHGERNSYSAIELRTRQMLQKEARRLGISENDATKRMLDFSGVEPVEDLGHLATRVQGAGGNLTNQVNESLAKSAANLERATAKLEAVVNPKVPAPVQGRPNQPALRVP